MIRKEIEDEKDNNYKGIRLLRLSRKKSHRLVMMKIKNRAGKKKLLQEEAIEEKEKDFILRELTSLDCAQLDDFLEEKNQEQMKSDLA